MILRLLSGQTCPKCSGLIVPEPAYGPGGVKCALCGWLQLGEIPVAMPEVPQLPTVLSMGTHAVECRNYRAKMKATGANAGTPHRKSTATINREVNHA